MPYLGYSEVWTRVECVRACVCVCPVARIGVKEGKERKRCVVLRRFINKNEWYSLERRGCRRQPQ